MGFVVDEVALVRVFLRVVRLSSGSIIPPVLFLIHSSPALYDVTKQVSLNNTHLTVRPQRGHIFPAPDMKMLEGLWRALRDLCCWPDIIKVKQ